MGERRDVRVGAATFEVETWNPSKFADLVEWAVATVAAMPASSRAAATTTLYGSDGSYVIGAEYQRPETDDEMTKRELDAARAAAAREAQERAALATLKAKYERA